jgi:HTH-type transcriptional regulator, transcriptional repressor of NAD biosynthesis genes
LPQRELGVIVGKFYPPHRGHKHLIDTASAQVRRLVVIVCSKPDETIPGELRAAWVREIHPRVEVMRIDDVYDPDDSAVWAASTIRWLGRPPDVAFTSEDYGPRWAALMGAEHIMVDRDRATVPCSASQIRAHPLGNLQFVEPCVRAFLVPRVVVLGAESTGTTTLAEDLAKHYGTSWVPEYGREYCEQLDDLFTHRWRSEEFERIAREQNRREDLAAREAAPVLICDTDAFAAGVWHERYIGQRSVEVEALATGRRHAHHLLTDVDIPFVQDGLRDGEGIRHWMHELFMQRLGEAGLPFVVVSGDRARRLASAASLVDRVLASLSF